MSVTVALRRLARGHSREPISACAVVFDDGIAVSAPVYGEPLLLPRTKGAARVERPAPRAVLITPIDGYAPGDVLRAWPTVAHPAESDHALIWRPESPEVDTWHRPTTSRPHTDLVAVARSLVDGDLLRRGLLALECRCASARSELEVGMGLTRTHIPHLLWLRREGSLVAIEVYRDVPPTRPDRELVGVWR